MSSFLPGAQPSVQVHVLSRQTEVQAVLGEGENETLYITININVYNAFMYTAVAKDLSRSKFYIALLFISNLLLKNPNFLCLSTDPNIKFFPAAARFLLKAQTSLVTVTQPKHPWSL
jgi:hypothetical protein